MAVRRHINPEEDAPEMGKRLPFEPPEIREAEDVPTLLTRRRLVTGMTAAAVAMQTMGLVSVSPVGDDDDDEGDDDDGWGRGRGRDDDDGGDEDDWDEDDWDDEDEWGDEHDEDDDHDEDDWGDPDDDDWGDYRRDEHLDRLDQEDLLRDYRRYDGWDDEPAPLDRGDARSYRKLKPE